MLRRDVGDRTEFTIVTVWIAPGHRRLRGRRHRACGLLPGGRPLPGGARRHRHPPRRHDLRLTPHVCRARRRGKHRGGGHVDPETARRPHVVHAPRQPRPPRRAPPLRPPRDGAARRGAAEQRDVVRLRRRGVPLHPHDGAPEVPQLRPRAPRGVLDRRSRQPVRLPRGPGRGGVDRARSRCRLLQGSAGPLRHGLPGPRRRRPRGRDRPPHDVRGRHRRADGARGGRE